jgi:hypothetical protein
MTTELDRKLANKVELALRRVGISASLVTVVRSYNPLTSRTTTTETTTTIICTPPVGCIVNRGTLPASAEGNQSAQSTGLRIITTPSLMSNVSPHIGDTVIISSRRYRITSYEPIYSGDFLQLYKIYLIGVNGI